LCGVFLKHKEIVGLLILNCAHSWLICRDWLVLACSDSASGQL